MQSLGIFSDSDLLISIIQMNKHSESDDIYHAMG